jgi:hypothetical protein
MGESSFSWLISEKLGKLNGQRSNSLEKVDEYGKCRNYTLHPCISWLGPTGHSAILRISECSVDCEIFWKRPRAVTWIIIASRWSVGQIGVEGPIFGINWDTRDLSQVFDGILVFTDPLRHGMPPSEEARGSKWTDRAIDSFSRATPPLNCVEAVCPISR